MKDLTKRRAIRSKAIRASAHGELCTWPGCDSPNGVVFAHSNMSVHGKGTGRKSCDIFGAYMCHEHHTKYDEAAYRGSVSYFCAYESHFMRAMSETWKRLVYKGIIKIEGHEP